MNIETIYTITTEQLRGELYKSEVLLIASTLIVMKAENIYRNTIKMHKTMETKLSHYTYTICGEASAHLYGEE